MSGLPPSRFFPAAETADQDGLIGLGGQLEPEWLLDAYRHGIFPWPITGEDTPTAWWSPDPRAIIELDRLRVSRRLGRTCRSGWFAATCDEDFAAVIRGCATAQQRTGQTWLTAKMIDAYIRMFELGHAHSIEVWHGGRLAGGIYGLAIAGLFAAESKFYRVRDASKVALIHLVAHLWSRGYQLLDIQQLTPHSEKMGAIAIPRRQYIARLANALKQPVSFGRSLQTDQGQV